MITPNKFISYTKSSLGHVEKIYAAFDEPTSLNDIYRKVAGQIDSIDIFFFAVEILYLADMLNVDLTTGIVSKC
jgi:hypothetical protein